MNSDVSSKTRKPQLSSPEAGIHPFRYAYIRLQPLVGGFFGPSLLYSGNVRFNDGILMYIRSLAN
jgi:hypothetical protein